MKAALFLRVFLVIFTMFSVSSVRAEKSLETKTKDAGSDLKKDYKKGVRKAKKQTRKAKGTNTPAKDAKDTVNDLGDDLNNGAEKLQHRSQK